MFIHRRTFVVDICICVHLQSQNFYEPMHYRLSHRPPVRTWAFKKEQNLVTADPSVSYGFGLASDSFQWNLK